MPCVGLAALCAAAAEVRSIAEALGGSEAAAHPRATDAAFPISLLHACLAHMPFWLQSAPALMDCAARDSWSQVRLSLHEAACACMATCYL